MIALPSISSALHNPKAFCQLAMSKLSDTADAFLRTVKAVIGHNFIHDSLHSLKELVMPALKERNLSSMASVSPKLITTDYDDCDSPLAQTREKDCESKTERLNHLLFQLLTEVPANTPKRLEIDRMIARGFSDDDMGKYLSDQLLAIKEGKVDKRVLVPTHPEAVETAELTAERNSLHKALDRQFDSSNLQYRILQDELDSCSDSNDIEVFKASCQKKGIDLSEKSEANHANEASEAADLISTASASSSGYGISY